MFRITEKRELFRIQGNCRRQFLKSGEEPILFAKANPKINYLNTKKIPTKYPRNFGLLCA
jgi:hypothetical protein